MIRRKPKTEEKPITAQPIGSRFLVKTGHSLKANLREDSKGRTIETGGLSGDGCYRRVPRFFND